MFLSDFQYMTKKNGLASARLASLKHYGKAIKNQPEKSLKMVGMSDEERAFRYDKAALVFSMIEGMIGKEKFQKALQNFYQEKKFKKANWDDLRKSFEKISGLPLSEFFDQWVNRAGVPSLRLMNNEVQKVKDGYEVMITLSSDPLFKLNIPIEIKTEATTFKKTIFLDKSPQSFVLQPASRPVSLAIDPEYSVIRKLLPEEIPPDMASVLDSQDEVGVVFSDNLTPEEKTMYESFLKDLGIKYKVAQTIAEVSDKGILLGPPGEDGLIGGWKPADVPWVWDKTSLGMKDGKISSGKDSAVMAWYGPNGGKQTLIWVMGYSSDGLTSLAKRLGYFKFASYVFLREGNPTLRGDWVLSKTPMLVQFPLSESK
jgi:aminopeptidase N